MSHKFGDYRLYIGPSHSDRYSGTERMDMAFGLSGNDRLRGWREADDLQGGDGNDYLAGGAGTDHLVGGKGSDRLVGGDGADRLEGRNGRDYLDEGAGHGDLDGGAGNDTLVGGPGADAFMVHPGSGDDAIKDFQAGPGVFDHLALRDITPEDLRFEDTSEGVRISWIAENGNGSVLLEGVQKADLAQDDFMFANDRMLIHPADPDAATVEATSFARIEGENLGADDSGGDDPGSRIARFDSFFLKAGTASADIFQATAHQDYYFGLDGDDQLFGAVADDDLHGDAGNDVLDGGDGSDHLDGGAGNDRLFGGAMADNLMGGDGNDELHAGADHDMINGGRGDDILDGGDGADAFMVEPDSGHDVVIGGFDAGPGAFDHIAFIDILPEEVQVEDVVRDDDEGVLVSWSSNEDPAKAGSIFLDGLSKSQMAQDDFMFNAVEGGAFVPDPEITQEGSRLIFASRSAFESQARFAPDLEHDPIVV